MKHSLVKIIVATTIGISSMAAFASISPVYANSLNELNEQKKDIESKKNDIENKLMDSSSQLEDIHSSQKEVQSEIERLNKAISSAQVKIVEKKEQISMTKKDIKDLEEQIKVLQERIEKRNELLKERARSYQVSGGMINYLDVLIGSQSFSDFIDRVGAVATIVEADQSILKEQEADKKLLEESQASLKTKLASLEAMLADLNTLEANLNSQKKEKDHLMKELKEEEGHVHAEMLSLEEEEKLLADQKVAMEKAIELEKKRIAEEARKAKEAEQKRKEEEAARAKAAAAAKNTNTSSNENNDSSSTVPVSQPPVSNGKFTRPAAAGYISSGLGQRWGTFHAGVDVAATGIVPIYAVADGVVISSYYSSSYGEVIFISHYIDGQQYTTVYAHLRSGSRSVNAGDAVNKGQQIGLMGNTGDSTGQHLHFELHRGPWNQAKSNAVNPIGIVPF